MLFERLRKVFPPTGARAPVESFVFEEEEEEGEEEEDGARRDHESKNVRVRFDRVQRLGRKFKLSVSRRRRSDDFATP